MKNTVFIHKSKFTRVTPPPPIRFQDRDSEIINAIHDYGGVLARRHLQQLFWHNKSEQVMQKRLSLLFHNGYLDWANQEQRRTKLIPEPLIWLGWRGVLHLAICKNLVVAPPKSESNNQMRLLQIRLRKQDIRWVKEPNWNQLVHDFHAIDFRLAVEDAVADYDNLYLEEWIGEHAFRASPDVIDYSFIGNNGKIVKKSKGVIPDGFFIIADASRFRKGKPGRVSFLLEIDMSTHDNYSFGVEKSSAGASYVVSDKYRNRFGKNGGIWLVVTTGKIRMRNLMKQTMKRVPDYRNIFYFTTLDKIATNNILSDAVWWQPNNDQPIPLPFEG